MSNHASLCLVLHNHQPIGNFDGVFEQAYQDSYLPFLEVFEPYEKLQISLHTSGPLMHWLAEHHPDYLDRVKTLVQAGRVEIIGGPHYEPILTMLPPRDRVGQIQTYSDWIERFFGMRPRGMWMPERVWESALTTDVVDAGMQYTVLDDYHFHGAGLREDQLTSYFLTEDNARVLKIFPGSESLRYTIPFRPVSETIDYCREFASRHPGAVLTFGDDGEKFGTWPDTQVHVYQNGWLGEFFDALSSNSDWLHTVSLAGAVQDNAPAGKTYLPDCSYREMTQWSLPVVEQESLDDLMHMMQDRPEWKSVQPFMSGGYWRNFKNKYEETNEMYARMMDISRRVEEAQQAGVDDVRLAEIRDQLYRGQCNCPYWHGAFGGTYLPHLRNAVYEHLIKADTMLDRALGKDVANVEATADDYNFDGMQEVRLSNDRLCAWIAPGRGGRMYELDVREISHNLLATLQRRPESYHRKVLAGPNESGEDVASIHDRVVFKQADLDQRLQYDRFARKSLMDHFYDNDVSMEAVARGEAMERGDFVEMPFDAKLRRGDDRVQLQMRREGNAWGVPLSITKAVTMIAGSDRLSITYLLENLPRDAAFHFGIEMNFAGMPAGAEDRYFSDLDGNSLGQLGHKLDLHETTYLGLSDRWLGLDVAMGIDRPSGIWAFPIETVSQSEAGFEGVHQSVCVQPHWIVRGDENGRWAVQMELAMTTAASVEVVDSQATIEL